MRITSQLCVAAMLAATLGLSSAQAQNVRVRGTIEKLDGNTLMVKSRDGADLKLTLKDNVRIAGVVKAALADKVSEVRASQRLTDSAACLVASAQGRDRELERLLARQNRGSGAKPILELNMGHDLVKALATAAAEKREADVADIAALLLDQAHILDGEVPADPAAFAKRLNTFVVRGLRSGA